MEISCSKQADNKYTAFHRKVGTKMKKVLAICLAVVMAVGMSFSAFAAPGSFLKSPSKNPAPRIERFVSHVAGCEASLVITPYIDRSELPENLKTLIEYAYSTIAGTNDLTTLNATLATLVAEMNIDPTDLAVSDLFDIHVVGCDLHDGHKGHDIVLGADTLDRFVGLLHMNKDGVWEFVSGAEVINNGKSLSFSVDDFSPFAIVVDTSSSSDEPGTGDNSMILLYSLVMVASATVIIVLAAKSKKQKAH
jgi:hypothetical protein